MNRRPRGHIRRRVRPETVRLVSVLVPAQLCVFAAAAAPSPVLSRFVVTWGTGPGALTGVQAAYSAAVVLTLVLAGSLADVRGDAQVVRRAGAALGAGMLVVACAWDIWGLLVGRVLQGVGVGLMAGVLSAAVFRGALHLRTRTAAAVSAALPASGFLAGTLGSGWVSSFEAGQPRAVFVLLAAGFAALAYAVPGRLPPRASEVRVGTVGLRAGRPSGLGAAAPTAAIAWCWMGFAMGLAPLAGRETFARVGLVAAASPLAAFTLAAAVGSLWLLRDVPVMDNGAGLFLALGSCMLVAVAVGRHDWYLFLGAMCVAGFAFVCLWHESLAILAHLASGDQAGAAFSGLQVVTYLAFGVPILLTGLAADQWGLSRASLVLLAVMGVASAAVLLSRGTPWARSLGSRG